MAPVECRSRHVLQSLVFVILCMSVTLGVSAQQTGASASTASGSLNASSTPGLASASSGSLNASSTPGIASASSGSLNASSTLGIASTSSSSLNAPSAVTSASASSGTRASTSTVAPESTSTEAPTPTSTVAPESTSTEAPTPTSTAAPSSTPNNRDDDLDENSDSILTFLFFLCAAIFLVIFGCRACPQVCPFSGGAHGADRPGVVLATGGGRSRLAPSYGGQDDDIAMVEMEEAPNMYDGPAKPKGGYRDATAPHGTSSPGLPRVSERGMKLSGQAKRGRNSQGSASRQQASNSRNREWEWSDDDKVNPL